MSLFYSQGVMGVSKLHCIELPYTYKIIYEYHCISVH